MGRFRLGRLVATTAIVGVLISPSVALIWILGTTSDHLDELEPQVEAVLTLPSEVTASDRRSVVVEITFGRPLEVLSSGPEGLVTDVFVGPGAELRHLEPIFEVDGVTRLGVHTDAPFFRRLKIGSAGPDVTRLEQVLAEAGFFLAEPDSRFDSTTKKAVKALETDLGAVSPDGEFFPDLFVWLSVPVVTLETLNVSVGEVAPGLGAVLGSGARPILSARLLDLNGVAAADIEPGEYELVVGVETVGVVDRAESLGADLREILGVLLNDDLGGTVDGGDNPTLRGEVQLVTPIQVTAVPTSAVSTSISGDRFCVWVSKGDGYQSALVTVVGGSVGVTEVAEVLDSDLEILVNPEVILSSSACQ